MERNVRGPAASAGSGNGGVAAAEEVAVPAQDGVRVDQQSESLQCRRAQWVQEGGQQCPVGRLEPDPLGGELSLQYGELVAQYEDLGVLVVVAAWQQP